MSYHPSYNSRPMNKIHKPEWLLFAEKTRIRLDNIEPTKSGKREERFIRSAWHTARLQKGYEGSDTDWEYLLHHLGKKPKS